MKIAIMETEGRTTALILSFSDYETRAQLEAEIEATGGQEKIVGFLDCHEEMKLTRILVALCAFGSGQREDFQQALEEMLAKIFQLGKEHGRVEAKENIKNNMLIALQRSSEKETELIGAILEANKE